MKKMTNKYEAYIKIGRALREGNEKNASDIAKIIIKSDRIQQKKGILFSKSLVVSREDKKVLKSGD